MIKDRIFYTIGGPGLLPFSVRLMSGGVPAVVSQRLREIVESMTKKAIVTFCIGTGATALLRSGLAATSVAISYVNTGLLVSKQAVCVIIGTDIGTASAGIVSTSGEYVITASVCAQLSRVAAQRA